MRRQYLPQAAAVLLAATLSACDASILEPDSPGSFTDLSVGAEHTCALDTDGRAWCWGAGTLGQLGGAASEDRPVPTRVRSDVAFTSIAAGHSHTCAITIDGVVYCWGWNQQGQLGTGLEPGVSGPVPIAGGHRFVALSAGWYHTCGIADGGTVYCWGSGSQGQLGHGAFADSRVPVAVAGGGRYTSVSAGGQHSCAIQVGGSAYCWGLNQHGQLGNGGAAPSAVPVAVAGGQYSALAAGATHTCGADGGAVRCWGSNEQGELGTGGLQQQQGLPGSAVPVFATGVSGASSVAAGLGFSCAAGAATSYCWGNGQQGQLGTGFQRINPVPQALATPSGSGADGLSLLQVRAGLQHACALTTSRAIFCWGHSPRGALGHPSVRATVLPVRVQGLR